jgi:hypothetical protein
LGLNSALSKKLHLRLDSTFIALTPGWLCTAGWLPMERRERLICKRAPVILSYSNEGWRCLPKRICGPRIP